MNRKPPLLFYVLGLGSLVLLCFGFVLKAQDTHPALAIALGVVGALGMFLCAWILKRAGP